MLQLVHAKGNKPGGAVLNFSVQSKRFQQVGAVPRNGARPRARGTDLAFVFQHTPLDRTSRTRARVDRRCTT